MFKKTNERTQAPPLQYPGSDMEKSYWKKIIFFSVTKSLTNEEEYDFLQIRFKLKWSKLGSFVFPFSLC